MQSGTARGQLILFGKRPETMALALSEMQNGRNTTVRSACGGTSCVGRSNSLSRSLLFFSVAGGMSAPARAGLVGVGTNTVSATSFIGAPLPAPVPPLPEHNRLREFDGDDYGYPATNDPRHFFGRRDKRDDHSCR